MIATCPNCGHQFSATTEVRDAALDAYVCVERGQMTNRSFASSRKLSSTTVTLYRRLGICLVEIGVDPVAEPKLWSKLVGSAAITDENVRTAIEQRVSLDRLRTLVQEAH